MERVPPAANSLLDAKSGADGCSSKLDSLKLKPDNGKRKRTTTAEPFYAPGVQKVIQADVHLFATQTSPAAECIFYLGGSGQLRHPLGWTLRDEHMGSQNWGLSRWFPFGFPVTHHPRRGPLFEERDPSWVKSVLFVPSEVGTCSDWTLASVASVTLLHLDTSSRI